MSCGSNHSGQSYFILFYFFFQTPGLLVTFEKNEILTLTEPMNNIKTTETDSEKFQNRTALFQTDCILL